MKRFCYGTVLLVSMIGIALGQSTIVQFSNTWSGTPATVNATTVTTGVVSPVTLSRGAGLTASSSSSRFSSNGFATGATLTLSNNDYYTLTITAGSGYQINLNSGQITVSLGSSGTGPATYGVFTSVGGFSSTSAQVGSNLTATTNQTITFPSSGYNSLSSIEIRIYGWNASAATGTGGPSAITISGAVVTSAPTLTVDTTTTSFNGAFGSIASGSTSAEHSFTVAGTNLTSDITITAPTGFNVSTTSGSGFQSSVTVTPTSGTVSAKTIYAVFSPNAVSSFADNITVAATGVTTFNVAVNGTGISPSTPTVTVTSTPSSLSEANLNSAVLTLTLANETFADNTLSLANFTLSNAPAGTSVSEVSYTNSTHADVLIAFDGSDFDASVSTMTVTVAGAELTGASPLTSSSISVTALSEAVSLGSTAVANFGAVVLNTASAEKNFTVSGSNLTGNISLVPPTSFEISTGTGGSFSPSDPLVLTASGNAVASTTIYVRYKPAAAHGTDSSTITVSSHGTATQTVSVNGVAIETEPTIASTISFGTVTSTSAVVNFTGGNGASRLLICRSLSAPDFTPVDSVTYSGASVDLPSAANPGGNASNRLVYQGSGTTVTVTGLLAGTAYYFAVIEYNGTGNTSNYFGTTGTNYVTTSSLDAIALTSSGYSQDFNTLTATGTTGSTMPAGWTFSESGANANATYTVDNGANTAGNTYSYGAASSANRSLGSVASGNLLSTFGASFTNSAGRTITQVPITYKGKQWRRGNTTSGFYDSLLFQYSTDATSLSTGTWTTVPALMFRSVNTSATAATLDGESVSNQASISGTITGLSIAEGSTFWIRWTDVNISGSDDGLAIDDLSIDGAGLPVELTSFTAAAAERGTELRWNTATEVNNHGFEIQRKLKVQSEKEKERDWETIGFVAGHGTVNDPQSYTFADPSARGTVRYRLKQVDRDGAFHYSGEAEATAALTAEDFALSQNFPNPFNPSTSFTFAVQRPEHAVVSVYDLLGKEVARLYDGTAPAGELIRVTFTGASLASGLYLYQLRTPSRTEVRKMLLMK